MQRHSTPVRRGTDPAGKRKRSRFEEESSDEDDEYEFQTYQPTKQQKTAETSRNGNQA